jgi:hypothetical protein
MARVSTGLCLVLAVATFAFGRNPGDPIRLAWSEGDVAGFTPIYAASSGGAIGRIDYHQRRRGTLLQSIRVARFADGSSDEDQAVAHLGEVLEAVRGRSIVREAGGRVVVDLRIDVPQGRLRGFYLDRSGERIDFDERVSLAAASYWGPLIFLVVKNFDANAEDGRVRFQTIVPTPQPRVLTMEVLRSGQSTLWRAGGVLGVERYTLRPLINRFVDPVVHALIPSTEFLVAPGAPPALARYEGPRNYAGQEIRIE